MKAVNELELKLKNGYETIYYLGEFRILDNATSQLAQEYCQDELGRSVHPVRWTVQSAG